MIKKITLKLLIILMFGLFTEVSYASHIANAELTYECLGNNQYVIHLNLVWDCTGGFNPGNPQTVTMLSSCGDSIVIQVNQTNATGGTDISQLCPTATSSCNGGTYQGFNLNTYTDTVTLPPCANWNFYWQVCCRNSAISNLAGNGSAGSYVNATLNTTAGGCNNSPYFTAPQLPYMCVGQQMCYNFGVVELDGDSLYYSLIQPQQYNFGTGPDTVGYFNASYSVTNPIPSSSGFNLNPYTGQLTFTPSAIGNYVIAIQVAEYNSAGVLIGYVIRDFQCVVFNCNNQTVPCSDGAITGLTGNTGVQTGPNSLTICENNLFQFTATFTDPNLTDHLTFTSNIAAVMPGAIITSSTLNNTLTLNVGWTPPVGSAGTNTAFTVTILDDACPVPGQQVIVYTIHVLPKVFAGFDQTICFGDNAYLHASGGGNQYIWSVVSGDPIILGSNFSCNNCDSPIATPTVTTTYQTIGVNGTCVNIDSVTITVVPNFTYNVSQSVNTACIGQPVQFNITNNPAGAYTYNWSPATYLNNTSIANPVATCTVSGNYTYFVTTASAGGCVKFDSLHLGIFPRTNAGPDQTICFGDAAQLQATGDGTSYTWSVISGPPMVIGTNFSCNNCDNPMASPAATTVYQVIGNNGNCLNTDTVQVFVATTFSYALTQSSTTTCLLDTINLGITNLNPGPPSAYTINWAPATYLSSTNSTNPYAIITTPGIFTYTVTLTNAQGCIKPTTISINAAPAFAPVITAFNDTTFCPGGTASLNVTLAGNTLPPVCGLSVGSCGSSSAVSSIGTGISSNLSTGWPAPYGNWYTSVVQQYLYTAAELNAAGIIGGKIGQIDFQVTSIPATAITTYHGYTIKMGCTNLTTFDATNPVYVSGLFTVFPPQTINVNAGWNTHVFPNAFEWDGVSNVIIEVCFSEGPPWPHYTYNCVSPNTTTTYVSTQCWCSDSQDQCGGANAFYYPTAYAHPDIRLHHCSIIQNPADFSYLWTPSIGNIANDTAQNTTAQPLASTTYTVTVTNTIGGCISKDTVRVNANSVDNIIITTPVGPYCVNAPADTLHVNVASTVCVWSGNGITNTSFGIFDPAIAGPGDHLIRCISLCGIGRDSVLIHVDSLPDATITSVPNQCVAGPDILLIAATNGGVWSGTGITDAVNGVFSPLIAAVGNHVITYTINTPCFSQDTIHINVVPLQDSGINPPAADSLCTSSAAFQFTAHTAGGVWSGTGITAVGINDGTFDPSLAGPGTYTITYTIAGLCGSSSTTVVSVFSSPVISITPNITVGCQPLTVTFTSTTDQPGGAYHWNFVTGDTSLLSNPTYTFLNYNGGVPYQVALSYTSPFGPCVSTTNTGILVHSQPVAHYTASPQPTDISNPEIHFMDLSNGVVDSWNWTLGIPGANFTSQNPSYTYADTGTYQIMLIVTNSLGPCIDTIFGNVVIDPLYTFYIPTAFSPDENGTNDLFMVKGDGLDKNSFEIRIFNRWGEGIYQSNDMLEGWNGKKHNTGSFVEQGVYVYKINVKDFKGLPHEYIGQLTVLR